MKKKMIQNPPKPKEFSVSPFKGLKGVTPVASPVTPPPEPVPLPPPPPDDGGDDLDLFLRAIGDVRPLPAPDGPPEAPDRPAAMTPGVARVRRIEEDDRALFLQALNGLEVRFEDEIPDEADSLRPISASRLKQLKQGAIRINLELDLHGLTRDEALESLGEFIGRAWRRGIKAVLVITGKGNNSPGEPVLQSAVAGWLRDKGKKMVVEFAPAPRDRGGTGAFVVFLREPEPDGVREPR